MSADGRTIDILTVGESLGLVIPDDIGSLATASHARIRFGGAESNVAIAAARLGASVTWVSRLGTDGLGDKIERTLRGEGVSVVASRDPKRLTAIMVKERPAPHRARVRYYRTGSAASLLTPEDVPDELIRAARVVHVTGITSALSPSARETVRSVVTRAQASGSIVSLDVNYRSALWSSADAGAELRRILPSVDLVFAGLDEATLLDPRIRVADDARALLADFGLRRVVIKLGSHGAVAMADEATESIAAYPVEIVDSVGAGDAFVAGYLCAFLDGRSNRQCLEQGAKAGAFACTVSGDWEGAPSVSDLDLLDSADPVGR